MAFGEINSWHHKVWLSVEFLVFMQKNVDFSWAFDVIHRGKMEQILLVYDLIKETVAAIMMLYKNRKVKVRSPDGDTNNFDIVIDVLQGDTLAPYLFIICLDYVLRSIDLMGKNGFKLAREINIRYLTQTITDADYANDSANTPAQAESLLYSLEREEMSFYHTKGWSSETNGQVHLPRN